MLFSWEPSPSAERYRVELSTSNSFTRPIDSVDDGRTAWAPQLTARGFSDGGKLYWRVAAVDEGRNVGGFTTGSFKAPKGWSVRPRAAPPRRAQPGANVTVTDANAGQRGKRRKLKVAGARRARVAAENKRGIAKLCVRGRRAAAR